MVGRLVDWGFTAPPTLRCVIWEPDEKPGSAGYGLTLTKPEGTQGIFILHAPIDKSRTAPRLYYAVGQHC